MLDKLIVKKAVLVNGVLFLQVYCLFVSLFLSSATAAGEETISVVTEYLAPYQLKARSGEVYGFAPEVVDRLFEITGYHQERSVLPWARAYDKALSGSNILIFSIAHTKMRENSFHWIGRLTTERLFFWGLAKKTYPPIRSFEDLREYHISISIGTNPEQYLTSQGHPKIYRVNDPDTSLAMILKGRTDLIIASKIEFSERMQKFNRSLSEFVPVYEIDEMNSQLSIAFSLDTHHEILQRFREAYQQMVDSGELQRLRDKWDIPS